MISFFSNHSNCINVFLSYRWWRNLSIGRLLGVSGLLAYDHQVQADVLEVTIVNNRILDVLNEERQSDSVFFALRSSRLEKKLLVNTVYRFTEKDSTYSILLSLNYTI